MADEDTLHNLQLLLASLQSRIKDLEIENSKLASRLSNCRCSQVEESTHENGCNGVVPMDLSEKPKHVGCKSKKKSLEGQTLHNQSKRHVALKLMYFGKRFYGFSSEAQMEPSIESELFKALERTRLLIGDRKESQYTRCGRTDKGVSSVGQVVALYLRSKIKASNKDATNSPELDYVRVINRALPNDIRVIGWCPAPVDLHARFSCLSREYKYFFWREDLDLSAMEKAGNKFLGEHDFRNFCKMDAINVHIYKRRVTSFEISLAERFGRKELWVFKIRGSAFLWHQIRCMVSVLFMIGQGLETASACPVVYIFSSELTYYTVEFAPEFCVCFAKHFLAQTLELINKIIDAMLDTERMRRKPQYSLASEAPLVLRSCEFKDLHFIISPGAREALRVHLQNEWQNHLMEAAISYEALQSLLPVEYGEMPPHEPRVKKKPLHVPLMTRITEPSYEERRAKLNLGGLKEVNRSKSDVNSC